MPEDELDLARLAAAVRPDTTLLCLANPNNPTGAHAPLAQVESLLDELPDRVLCVLDEAYFGFVDPKVAVDGASLVSQGRTNLCVVRTFSKAFGLASFRVGYAVAAPEIADGLNRIRTMFNVNQPAQAAAVESLARQSEIDARCESLRSRRAALAEALARLGLQALPSQGNFLFCRVGDQIPNGDPSQARLLADRLLEQGVIVRSMEGFGAPGALRITIGAPAESAFLLTALERVRGSAAGERT